MDRAIALPATAEEMEDESYEADVDDASDAEEEWTDVEDSSSTGGRAD